MQIHFVARALASQWPDIDTLDEDDIARHARRFRGGINNWIVQTFIRVRKPLLAADMTPTIGERLVGDCVNVAHRDSLNRLLAPYHRSYIVGVRADRPPLHSCKWELVQNDLERGGPQARHMPFWPQPGLVPRDAERGTRVERIAYFGRTAAAPAWFYDQRFHSKLRRLGVEFEIRDGEWFDYRDVDLVLAHRIESPTVLRHKPASKLVNAWLAGTPALLANEPAYAALKRSALDYIGIESPYDVIKAVERLRGSPQHYLAMVSNGRRRGEMFDVVPTKERWLRLLLDEVIPAAIEWRDEKRYGRGWINQLARMSRQKIASKYFKLRVYHDWQRQSYLRIG